MNRLFFPPQWSVHQVLFILGIHSFTHSLSCLQKCLDMNHLHCMEWLVIEQCKQGMVAGWIRDGNRCRKMWTDLTCKEEAKVQDLVMKWICR